MATRLEELLEHVEKLASESKALHTKKRSLETSLASTKESLRLKNYDWAMAKNYCNSLRREELASNV